MIDRRYITPGLIVAAAVAFVIASLVSVILFFLFFEKPWLRYTNIPFPSLQSVGHPGKPMPIHVARCNDDSVPHVYSITRSLERVTSPNESRDYVLMQDVNVQIMPGCSEGDSIVHVIPPGTRAGLWRLVGVTEIHGVLRNHLVEWYSVPFEVSKK